ncbi:MAG: hypothetical protein MUP81_02255 [Dehalococcoidia bacterium]|nr:hypothetical protein [Dehalococcoidia bacterium]
MHWVMWYHWFWADVCGLPHPFTYYMRLSANEHPLWWILVPIVLGVSFYLVLWFAGGKWWHRKSEREKHLGWYLGSIIIGVAYYLLITHLWGLF